MKPPVHTLTPQQAVAELEQLLDAKPVEQLALIHWTRDNQARVDELEAWLLMHPAVEPEPAPIPEAAPVTKPKEPTTPETPAAALARWTANYAKLHAELTATPGDKALRERLNMARFKVRRLAAEAGVPEPDLLPPPESPYGQKLRPEPKAPTKKAPAPPPDPELLRVIADPPATRQAGVIHEIRREIWLLMADLETMTPELRAGLVTDLALLDAAAHAAHGLATGQLQVA